MPGTSAQSGTPSCQVFISHRGVEMKFGFANFLYEDLTEAGIPTFLDMESLPVGEDVRNNMLEACDEAQIHVPVFTPKYGTSNWCLEELALMMKCKNEGRSTVIPVFFNMEPEDLRKPNSEFAQKLEEYLRENNFEDQKMRRWKEALSDASWLAGFRLNDHGGRQGKLIKELGYRIRNEIFDRTPADAECYAVGWGDKVEDVVQRYRLRERTTSIFVFLIWGMEGLGKTTLARAIYLHVRKTFRAASFVDNCCDLKDVTELQSRLRADLLRDKCSDVMGGKEALRGRLRVGLRDKRVLIVLDGVKDYDSVEDAIKLKYLCPGSLILLTSRDRRAFPHESDLDSAFTGDIYQLLPMNSRESFELFCHHAFKGICAIPDFEKKAEQVVKACGGLPLALKKVGQHLSKVRNLEAWSEAARSTNKFVWGSFNSSYETLDEEEQEMFQDVACFFIGEPVHRAKQFWAATAVGEPETGLENLKQLCLVEVGPDACLCMHELLRDLGRSYSRKRKTRFWNDDDLRKSLAAETGLERIRGIATSQDYLDAKYLSRMRDLQLLFLDKTTLIGGRPSLSTLRWLRWKRCPHPTPPENLSLSLAILELELRVDTLWQFPPSITDSEGLRVLDMWSACCIKGWRREQVFKDSERFDTPQTSDSLEKSLWVRLVGFDSFTQLPFSVGRWNGLRFLCIMECTRLLELPQELGSLASLEMLLAYRLESITQLPPSLGQLKRLRVLNVGWCQQLKGLPEDLGSIESLEDLLLAGLESITRLPSSLSHLKRLQTLDIGGCKLLRGLPEDLGSLESLQELRANGLEWITWLPSSLSDLKRLKKLEIGGCKQLQELPEDLGSLESLEALLAHGLESLTRLPFSLSHLKSLQTLDIGGCKLLRGLPEDLGSLKSLQELRANGLELIIQLPSSLSDLKRLQKLDIGGCKQLQWLPEDLGSLESLENFCADGLESITQLPSSFSHLKRLQTLDIGRCKLLQGLPEDLGSLESLQELRANGLELITQLPSSLSHLKRLQKLDIGGCRQLQGLPKDFGSLESLEDLCADGLEWITQLPSSLSHLKRVGIRHWWIAAR